MLQQQQKMLLLVHVEKKPEAPFLPFLKKMKPVAFSVAFSPAV